MKSFKYEVGKGRFVDITVAKEGKGNFIDIEVSDEQAELIIELKRQDESYARKLKRRTLKEASLEYLREEFKFDIVDKTVAVQDEVEREEMAERVRWAVAYLTKKQQLLVELHFYEDKPFSEIAEMLGVSKSAVTQQFKTIYKTLQNILKDF